MEAPDAHWVAQTLIPYLRYAFVHALPYGADITPLVTSAVNVCMEQPYASADHDDLLFERVCMAIEFRYKNSEPELKFLTEKLQNLARFLIRRAQVAGPYELLGRMNIGSGAWQEYERGRLEKLRVTAEKEKYDNEHPFRVPAKPKKALPTEDQIDPRLVNAVPGQCLDAELFGPLTVGMDQAYRQQNRVLKRSLEQWMQQQHAQQPTSRSQGPVRHTPAHNGQAAGYRQHPHAPPQRNGPRTQGLTRGASIQSGSAAGHQQQPYAPPQQHALRTQDVTHHTSNHTGLARTPYRPIAAAPSTRALSSAPLAPIADTPYLRAPAWTQEALEQRSRDWTLLINAQKAQQLLRLPGEHHAPQPRATAVPYVSASNAHYEQRPAVGSYVQQQASQATSSQPGPQDHTASSVMHPGFSNVTIAFPNAMLNGRNGVGDTRRG